MSKHTDRRLSTDVKRAGRWLLPNVARLLGWMAVGFGLGMWWLCKASLKVGAAIMFVFFFTAIGAYKPMALPKKASSGD